MVFDKPVVQTILTIKKTTISSNNFNNKKRQFIRLLKFHSKAHTDDIILITENGKDLNETWEYGTKY